MKGQLAFAAIALLFFTATDAYAACTRDDVSFFLSKGFSQEQITAICTRAKEAPAPSTPARQEPATSIEVLPPASNKNRDIENYLRQVIKGHDIRIKQGFLHYTAKVCIPYGRYNTNKEPWQNEACELVRHKVALRGMKAKREWVSMDLFQPRQIYLEGRIEREFVSDLNNFTATNRRQIIQNLQTEVKAIVPIKENMSPDRLLKTLNRIAT